MRRALKVPECLLGLTVVSGLADAGLAAAQTVEAVTTVTVERAARMIRGQHGRVRLVLLYATTCPDSRAMFPAFVELASEARSQGVSVLAFASDETREAVQYYLGNASLPFRRYHLQPWQPGALDRAMRPASIDIGETWGTPLIAVIDEEGGLVGQWEGRTGARRARTWLRELGFDL